MKLRAPRCRDAKFVTSSAACQLAQSAPAPAGASAPRASALARRSASSSAGLLMGMESDPLGHRLHRAEARVPRHQQEEQEIDDGKDAREKHVEAFGRLQCEIAEYHERQRKQAE